MGHSGKRGGGGFHPPQKLEPIHSISISDFKFELMVDYDGINTAVIELDWCNVYWRIEFLSATMGNWSMLFFFWLSLWWVAGCLTWNEIQRWRDVNKMMAVAKRKRIVIWAVVKKTTNEMWMVAIGWIKSFKSPLRMSWCNLALEWDFSVGFSPDRDGRDGRDGRDFTKKSEWHFGTETIQKWLSTQQQR